MKTFAEIKSNNNSKEPRQNIKHLQNVNLGNTLNGSLQFCS